MMLFGCTGLQAIHASMQASIQHILKSDPTPDANKAGYDQEMKTLTQNLMDKKITYETFYVRKREIYISKFPCDASCLDYLDYEIYLGGKIDSGVLLLSEAQFLDHTKLEAMKANAEVNKKGLQQYLQLKSVAFDIQIPKVEVYVPLPQTTTRCLNTKLGNPSADCP